LMNSKMESSIRLKLAEKQIKPSLKPPIKILIKNEK